MTYGTLLDCHVHTAQGSSDSSLQIADMAGGAQRLGLGVNLSEHNRTWESFKLAALREETGLLLVRGMEVTTDMGHILVIGLDQYYSGIRSARRLREVCTEKGALMIVAHPFRHLLERKPGAAEEPFRARPDEAAERMEVFSLADAIEVGNGGTARAENAFAFQVATVLGKPMVGGSDAHSTNGFGSFTTGFADVLTSDAEVIAAIRDGASTCIEGAHLDAAQPFLPGDDEALARV
jgi:predicted metal-dependent phosphoesterase TrpH